MQGTSNRPYIHTSITLRSGSKRRFLAGLMILRRNGVLWSESELLHRLAKMYLRHWRGRGAASAQARRYNRFSKRVFERVAWYIDRKLHFILWQRATHSGVSISRMLDFAIRFYLPRLLEEYLQSPIDRVHRSMRNAPYWGTRNSCRHNPQREIFITYQRITEKNDERGLILRQEYHIWQKHELFWPMRSRS